MFRTLVALSCLVALVSSTDSTAQQSPAKQLLPQVPQNRNLFCFNCYEMIDIIEQEYLLDEPNLKKHLENWCDAVYGHMGTMADECKLWVDNDLDLIIDKLNNGWSAEAICKDLHFCS